MENKLKELDHFYDQLPGDVQELFLYLRKIIVGHDSLIKEYFKWGVPFFHYQDKPLCYLNFSKKSKPSCYIGFAKLGFKEAPSHPALQSLGRKSVRLYVLHPENDLNIKELESILDSIISSEKA